MPRYEVQARKYRTWACLLATSDKTEAIKKYKDTVWDIENHGSPYADVRLIEVLRYW